MIRIAEAVPIVGHYIIGTAIGIPIFRIHQLDLNDLRLRLVGFLVRQSRRQCGILFNDLRSRGLGGQRRSARGILALLQLLDRIVQHFAGDGMDLIAVFVVFEDKMAIVMNLIFIAFIQRQTQQLDLFLLCAGMIQGKFQRILSSHVSVRRNGRQRSRARLIRIGILRLLIMGKDLTTDGIHPVTIDILSAVKFHNINYGRSLAVQLRTHAVNMLTCHSGVLQRRLLCGFFTNICLTRLRLGFRTAVTATQRKHHSKRHQNRDRALSKLRSLHICIHPFRNILFPALYPKTAIHASIKSNMPTPFVACFLLFRNKGCIMAL